MSGKILGKKRKAEEAEPAAAADEKEPVEKEAKPAEPDAPPEGPVKLDVYLAYTPMDKYLKALLRQAHGTELHDMREWSELAKAATAQEHRSD